MAMSEDAARTQLPAAHFLSNEDLATLLTLSTPSEVGARNYFSQLFSGVVGVKTDSQQNILAAFDSVGNTVDFSSPISTKGKNVIGWLSDLRAKIPEQLRSSLLEAWGNDPDAPLVVLASKYPSQIAILILQLRYTIFVNKALESSSLSPVEASLTAQVTDAIKVIGAAVTISIREHKTLSTLITIAIGQLDQARRLSKILAEDSVDSARQAWSQALQFTFDPTSGQVTARSGATSVQYGFHFVSAERLARFAFTDSVYHTTLAAKGAVVVRGQAGTGKTEVQKDLAADLGYSSIVINCSEEMSVAMLEALGRAMEANPDTVLIFDELNRSFVGQPAAVGALLQLATDARRAGRLPLWTAFTFNPHRADAAGLPTVDADVIDMTPPDLLAVTRVIFAMEGIAEYAAAAELTWGFLAWAKGALSPQPVYDWGLRTLKATAKAAGRLRALGSAEGVREGVRRSLDGAVVARLTAEDRAAAEAQLATVFGGGPPAPLAVSVGDATSAVPAEKLGQVLCLSGLRHGVGILTADAAAAAAALSAAAPLLGIRAVAVPRDAAWPAPLAAALRAAAADPAGTRTWLVVTGALAVEDFEGLNTALDDNRLLVLPDGARVPVPASTSIVFVGQDFDALSPASVSRLGVVRLPK